MDDKKVIELVISKLKSEISEIDLSIWTTEQDIEKVRDNIKDMEDMQKLRKKEIAVLNHVISVL